MKIGLVGLGRMGAAIAQRLAEQGLEVVAWDRRDSAARACASRGTRVVAGPRAVAERGRDHHLDHHRGYRRARPVPGRGRFPCRRCRRQAVHRNEHAAADDEPRTRGAGRAERRPFRRCAGARNHPGRARWQARGHGRRTRGGYRSGASRARQARAPHRSHGPGRQRSRHEACRQYRSCGLCPGRRGVAGAGRETGACARPDARRSGRDRHRGPMAQSQAADAARRAGRHLARPADAAQGRDVGGCDRGLDRRAVAVVRRVPSRHCPRRSRMATATRISPRCRSSSANSWGRRSIKAFPPPFPSRVRGRVREGVNAPAARRYECGCCRRRA